MSYFIKRLKAGHDLRKKRQPCGIEPAKKKGRKTGLTVIEAYPVRAWPERERNNMP